MTSMSNAGRDSARVLVFVAATILALGSIAATPETNQEPENSVGRHDSDSVFVADPEAPWGTVLLKDLRRVEIVSLKARESMIGERTYRPAVGVMAPSGAVKGTKAWSDSPLVRVDVAKITTMLISSELPGGIQAGYIPPSVSGEERKAWLVFLLSGMPGEWATGEFVLETESEAGELFLREVVAIDLEQIYFKAASINPDTGFANPDEFFVVAEYSLVAP